MKMPSSQGQRHLHLVLVSRRQKLPCDARREIHREILPWYDDENRSNSTPLNSQQISGESNVHDTTINYATQPSALFTTAPSNDLKPHRVACFRTQGLYSSFLITPPNYHPHHLINKKKKKGTLSPDSKTQLRIHVCYEPKYATSNTSANETDIEKVTRLH